MIVMIWFTDGNLGYDTGTFDDYEIKFGNWLLAKITSGEIKASSGEWKLRNSKKVGSRKLFNEFNKECIKIDRKINDAMYKRDEKRRKAWEAKNKE